MAVYTAHNLATAAGRQHESMARMLRDIDDIVTAAEAVSYFEGRDREAHTAVRTMLAHHLRGTYFVKGGGKKAEYDHNGADATWAMTKKFFAKIVNGEGMMELMSKAETSHTMRETARILKEYAAR